MPNSPSTPVVVIAPDSFKGSLSAEQVAQAIASGVRRARPDAEVRICPMADGGEGTLDAMLTRGGERRTLSVRGAAGPVRDALAGVFADGSAIVETAEVVGITDPVGMGVPVEARSTRGMGEAIGALLDAGVRRFFVALGGSSTNDGGAGLLAGLGVKLFDARGNALEPTPEQLARVARVDVSQLDARLADAHFIGMSDVDNPLTGEHGATAVFGPQKGVKPDQVATIDAALARYADLLEAALGRTARELPGAGAAGGLGFALHLLGAQFEPGAETVARQIGLDAALAGANWLITGEGRSDVQTLHGKAPFIACRHAQAAGVPATLLSGAVDSAALPRLADYFSGCFSPAPGPITLEFAIRDAARLLADEAEQLTRLKYGAR
ncbi:glycerate kinase [Paraburkholderia phenoliruptrix]|uniref:Glycerate 3-kinase n=2 Tax=Paraburkholderia phenoliruptrix TaxID=252970 RepID=A0A6J5K5U7_9BURK|nr:glycerate kinase [Paraburkholderia phenoliruptrix]AFT85795.1 glycerate kinase [Paraburkholderia phenoliruptrix BR3459a]MDR6392196.1 glycerate kinase [Paraburkholderia phenoliruptrix]CAB4048315.1 Glycerate 3-kinase [Paraburkholderia phenoliruptrix]